MLYTSRTKDDWSLECELCRCGGRILWPSMTCVEGSCPICSPRLTSSSSTTIIIHPLLAMFISHGLEQTLSAFGLARMSVTVFTHDLLMPTSLIMFPQIEGRQ